MSKSLSRSGLLVTLVVGLAWGLQGISEEPAAKEPPTKEAAAQEPAAKEEVKGATEAAAAAPPTQAQLEQEFERTMSGCVLVGRFTIVGKEDQAPKEERYTITKVKKQEDGEWIFLCRIQYGKNDASIPLKLKVEWAGDTPVITLTDLTIPGMGTFTSRVLIYRGWYAGTWQHGPVGGHLFGKIEKLPEEKKSSKKKPDGEAKADETKKTDAAKE